MITENRILRNQIDGRVQLTDSERKELAELGAKLGKKALAEIATVAQPDTILAWNRKFADPQGDTSAPRKSVGRPRVDQEIEDLVLRMARENRSWGYDRMQGALKHLGYTISDQTVGNILKRHSISPAPERKKTVTWREFVRIHMDVLGATDFFSSEVWNWLGLVISGLLCFIPFRRPRGNVSDRVFHLHVPLMQLRRAWSLDLQVHIVKWICWTKMIVRSRYTQLGKGLRRYRLCALASRDHREGLLQNGGKVLIMPAVAQRPIRDGPVQRQQQLDGRLICHNRQAA